MVITGNYTGNHHTLKSITRVIDSLICMYISTMQVVLTLTVEQQITKGTPAVPMMAQNGPVVDSMMMTSIPRPCAVVVAEDHRQHKVIT